MVTWYAGLFYLPRLFVYHAMCAPDDRVGIERFKTMERKLYYGIMMPGMVLTVVFGPGCGWATGSPAAGCTRSSRSSSCCSPITSTSASSLADFKHDRNAHGHVFYRWLNEIPALPILVAVVFLVVMKPF